MLDIDEPEVAASVHVYVNTSRLTSLDPRALLVVTARPAHPTLVPCTPAQPGVRVQLLAGDTELTEYQGPVINLSNIFWVSRTQKRKKNTKIIHRLRPDWGQFDPRLGFRLDRVGSSRLVCVFSAGARTEEVRVVLCSAPSVPQPVVQSWRRPLL